MFILDKKEINDLNKFIDYWAKLYKLNSDFDKEMLYTETIGKTQFTDSDINKLFKWKNQMKLSDKKQKSLNDKILSKIDFINNLKQSDEIKKDEFLEHFKPVSAVWKLFLLHTIKPEKYPIYDQHVHRCYNIIKGLPFDTINAELKEKVKIEFYFNDYLPFIQEVSKKIEMKKIDEALVSFGQFFASKKNCILIFGNEYMEKSRTSKPANHANN